MLEVILGLMEWNQINVVMFWSNIILMIYHIVSDKCLKKILFKSVQCILSIIKMYWLCIVVIVCQLKWVWVKSCGFVL